MAIYPVSLGVAGELPDLARRLARRPADPDPPRHAHALDVGRPAGMHRDDAVALLQLEEALGRAPCLIRGERLESDRLEDRPGHPEPRHLAVVRELRPLVGAR